ncbi:MAG TPA: hypothetical protein VFU48_12200 [Nitrospira sp.]|nr:hypothetical protein [Nitrospira sp.]
MAEGKETPPIRFREALAVLHGNVDAVEFPIEKASSGRLCTRAIREGWVEDACQLLHDHCALRE